MPNDPKSKKKSNPLEKQLKQVEEQSSEIYEQRKKLEDQAAQIRKQQEAISKLIFGSENSLENVLEPAGEDIIEEEGITARFIQIKAKL